MSRRLLSFSFFMLLMTSVASAQFGTNLQPSVKLKGRSFADLYASQKILLSNYCRLDFEGARLEPTGWERLKPFTSIHTNPEFNNVVVVTRFATEQPEQPSEHVIATYQVVGTYDEEEGFSAGSKGARVNFRVQEQNGILLVTDIDPAMPHVSPRAAVAWMNVRLADPKTNDLARVHLKDAVNRLSKLLPANGPESHN